MAFIVGDKGKTRDGSSYEVLSVEESFYRCRVLQPIMAKIIHGAHVNASEYFSEDGQFDTAPGAWDLMPPDRSVEQHAALYTAACEQFEAAQLALEKAKQAVADARLNLCDALDGEA